MSAPTQRANFSRYRTPSPGKGWRSRDGCGTKKTTSDVLPFKNQLEAANNEIVDKITLINESLREIGYSPGTYIRLVPDQETDAEIRNFQTDLKNCLKDTLGQEDYYNEDKYLQVKKLLDRFDSEESAEKTR